MRQAVDPVTKADQPVLGVLLHTNIPLRAAGIPNTTWKASSVRPERRKVLINPCLQQRQTSS